MSPNAQRIATMQRLQLAALTEKQLSIISDEEIDELDAAGLIGGFREVNKTLWWYLIDCEYRQKVRRDALPKVTLPPEPKPVPQPGWATIEQAHQMDLEFGKASARAIAKVIKSEVVQPLDARITKLEMELASLKIDKAELQAQLSTAQKQLRTIPTIPSFLPAASTEKPMS